MSNLYKAIRSNKPLRGYEAKPWKAGSFSVRKALWERKNEAEQDFHSVRDARKPILHWLAIGMGMFCHDNEVEAWKKSVNHKNATKKTKEKFWYTRDYIDVLGTVLGFIEKVAAPPNQRTTGWFKHHRKILRSLTRILVPEKGSYLDEVPNTRGSNIMSVVNLETDFKFTYLDLISLLREMKLNVFETESSKVLFNLDGWSKMTPNKAVNYMLCPNPELKTEDFFEELRADQNRRDREWAQALDEGLEPTSTRNKVKRTNMNNIAKSKKKRGLYQHYSDDSQPIPDKDSDRDLDDALASSMFD